MMSGSHSERQAALLELLARIRQAPNRRRRLALRDELAALVASFQLDGNAADTWAESETAKHRKTGAQ